jgi:serine/threonine protein kinase
MTHQEFQQRYTYNPSTDQLGDGGFGEVFKAYDTVRDRWVAIKVAKVRPELESVRLKKEVELVNKLPEHPNIAYYEHCYTFREMSGEYDFGILQYYEEGNLLQLLKKGTLTVAQKQSVLAQIVSGLQFLHDNGIIHRDLKPQNILIAKRGNEYIPKITDFGISKKLDVNKSSVFNNSLVGAGTLAYSSPEQLGDKEIRKNADLWSFGVIAFQVLTGVLPFNTGAHAATSESGRQELFRQIHSGRLPDAIYSISDPWQKLIRQCLVNDPSLRIHSTQDCRDILDSPTRIDKPKPPVPPPPVDLPTRIEKPAPKPKPVPVAPPSPPKPSGKQLPYIIAGTVVGILLVVVVIGVIGVWIRNQYPGTVKVKTIPADTLVDVPRQAVESKPEAWIANFNTYIAQGDSRYNNKDYPAAKEEYSKALNVIPSNATDGANKRNQANDKITDCDRMIDREKTAVAEKAAKAEKERKAEQERNAQERKTELANTLNRANVAFEAKDWTTAFALYKKVNELDPFNTTGYTKFMEQGKTMKAINEGNCNDKILVHFNRAQALNNTEEIRRLINDCK